MVSPGLDRALEKGRKQEAEEEEAAGAGAEGEEEKLRKNKQNLTQGVRENIHQK